MSSIEKAIDKIRAQKNRSEEKHTSPLDSGRHDSDVDNSQLYDEYDLGEMSESTSPRVSASRFESIDFFRLKSAGILVPDTLNGQLVEEFRQIKRPLLQNAFKTQLDTNDLNKLVMVTSALPGEGKTFTAISLAMSIAMEKDKTVLLVDADVEMGDVSKTLGIAKGKGLSDLLSDRNTSLSDVLVATNVPNLTLLSAGLTKGNMTELLSSDRMHRLVDELSQRYPDRIVVFDSPPLAVTSEPRVLAGLVGQILIVVEAEKTSQRSVEEAINHIDKSKTIGFVLNKTKRSSGLEYGYYGSGADSAN